MVSILRLHHLDGLRKSYCQERRTTYRERRILSRKSSFKNNTQYYKNRVHTNQHAELKGQYLLGCQKHQQRRCQSLESQLHRRGHLRWWLWPQPRISITQFNQFLLITEDQKLCRESRSRLLDSEVLSMELIKEDSQKSASQNYGCNHQCSCNCTSRWW